MWWWWWCLLSEPEEAPNSFPFGFQNSTLKRITVTKLVREFNREFLFHALAVSPDHALPASCSIAPSHTLTGRPCSCSSFHVGTLPVLLLICPLEIPTIPPFFPFSLPSSLTFSSSLLGLELASYHVAARSWFLTGCSRLDTGKGEATSRYDTKTETKQPDRFSPSAAVSFFLLPHTRSLL